MLRQGWEQEVKLVNYYSPSARKDPLHHVSYHSTMDSYEEDDYVVAARVYMRNEIMATFGLSLTEWMALPQIRKAQLITLRDAQAAEKAAAMKQLNADLEGRLGGK